MIDFLIVYELPQRELENVALLAAELERRGYTVELQKYPFENIRELRKKYCDKVRVVLCQSMYNERVLHNLVYHIAGKVEKIVNLQWEQIGTVQDEENNSSARMPKGSAKNIPHLCWGTKPQEMLLKSGMDKDRAVVTGPIQIDFLREEFDGYYKQKEELFVEFGIPVNKKTALFISSLSYTSIDEKEVHRLEGALGTEFVTVFRENSIKTQKEILEWIEKILKENEDLVFIYRPHPAEVGSAILNEAKEKIDRFYVINKYSVKQWIKRCDFIYNWFSTSAAEVYYSGKKAFVLRPVKLDEKFDVALLQGCNFITDYESFKETLSGKDVVTVLDSVVNRYYDVGTVPSYIRTADFLENVIETDEFNYTWSEDTKKFCRNLFIKKTLKRLLSKIKGILLVVVNHVKKMLGLEYNDYYICFYKKKRKSLCDVKEEEKRVRALMSEMVNKK